MMAYTCNPSLQNAEAGKSEASLVYIHCYTAGREIQQEPVSKQAKSNA